MSQAEQEATSTDKPISNHPKNISEKGYRCVCLNARSIVNKKNELNIMVEDIDPHIIGITESWANIDITDAELGLTGYVMFRKDRIGRRGGGVILYVKESIQAYEIKLEREADCDEAVWCKIVSGNSKLTIGLVYRSPNINEEDNTKIKNAIDLDLTRFAIQAKGPDGKWTRKPLAYRESNNVHLLIACPPEICVNLVFKHIHAASSYTIC